MLAYASSELRRQHARFWAMVVEPDRWTARLGWWGLPKWKIEMLTVNIDGVATQDAAAVAVHSGGREPDEGTLDIAVNSKQAGPRAAAAPKPTGGRGAGKRLA